MADFEKIKEAISIEQVAKMLQLDFKTEQTSLRCECPVHGGGARSLSISRNRTPGLFNCLTQREGGNCIQLVAHVKQIQVREAGEILSKHFGLDSAKTAPAPSPPQEAASSGMKPIEYLDPFASQVEDLGISSLTADAVGIGWANKGFFRGGMVGVPVRLPNGELLGYFGIPDGTEVKFHKSIEENAANVVSIKRA